MTLDDKMVAAYRRDGFLMLPPGTLPDGVLDDIRNAVPRVMDQEGPHRILERDGTTVRSVYGPHQTDPVLSKVVRLPVLVEAAKQLIGDDVYVHQSKINVKASFTGDQWEWHQDYINWLRADAIQRPDLVNVAVFLDEVNEFNGPLTFIPGSHRNGLLAGTDSDGMPVGYEDAPSWVSTLTANEKFQLDHAVIESEARRGGLVSAKGPAGSVLMFHANVLHASGPNLSPFRRAVLLLVYNGVGNAPLEVANPRPAFLAEREIAAL
ncbi:phytanoyl-CoA dioxygenase family protein [Actinoplanes cyaneus]|nr:phytanoyl-CoA dioxygenase family protein [Actinoplanes cyaneus]